MTRSSRLLVARDRGGYPLGLWLRWNARPYLIQAVLLVAYLALMAYAGTWLFFALALDFGLGTVLRDVGWLRGVRKMYVVVQRAGHRLGGGSADRGGRDAGRGDGRRG